MLKKLTFLTLSLLFIFAVGFLYKSQKAQADQSCSTTYCGTTFAWSSNIGWINASSTNPSISYAIAVDGSGNFSGYAWANPEDDSAGTNNIGWLQINTASAPASGGKVTGQATFLSADNQDWDGVVKFDCQTYCDVEYNP